MKKLIIAFILIWTCSIAYSQNANNNWNKIKWNFIKHFRYPDDLEKASIPSFFTLKVHYDEKVKQYNLEFSDSTHPLMIKEVLRIKDKLDFDQIYEDLNIENRDIPIIIPVEIKIQSASQQFSDPKNKTFQDLYNFKGKQAVGEFILISPLSLWL